MAYQPCTIDGDGGFSKLNSPPTRSGSVSAKGGEAWVRFLQIATVTVSGVNTPLVSPQTSPFTDGWVHLQDGDTVSFGVENVHETAGTDPIGQIDVYNIGASVVIMQH